MLFRSVLHEYSTIEGVQEDVVDVLLNLKGVVMKLHGRGEVTLKLKKEKPGPVTAADIEQSHDVEIVNPEHVIANLTKAGELTMQIKIEKGRGYRPALQRAAFEESLASTLPVRGVVLRESVGRWPAGPRTDDLEVVAFDVPGPSPAQRGTLEAVFQRGHRLGEWDFQLMGHAAHLAALVLEVERRRGAGGRGPASMAASTGPVASQSAFEIGRAHV